MITNNKFFKLILVSIFIASFISYNIYNNNKIDNEFEEIEDESESIDEQLKRLMILNN
tara:strand:- start:2279 stop:2452 length:174 start_codon:yes stop_codon:yes gene_type:complete